MSLEKDKVMGRVRNIGRVKDVEKIWLSMRELSGYLGVSSRYIKDNIMGKIHFYRISEKVVLFDKAEVDRMILRNKVV